MNLLNSIHYLFVFILMSSAFLPFKTSLGNTTYSQMTAVFSTEREFSYEYSPRDNSLILEFMKTSPEELKSFENYDDAHVKRVIIKDMGAVGTKIKIVLKTPEVRAHIQSFNEPFRVSIDLFDKHYELKRDPKTLFPKDDLKAKNAETPPNNLFLSKQNPSESSSSKTLLKNDEGPPPQNQTPNTPSKRRLLQPLGQTFIDPQDMEKALTNIADGFAPKWQTYPPYIFRLQTITYENRDLAGTLNRQNSGPTFSEALSSSKAMAEFAGRTFDLGHENKALVLYNQLLQKDPEIFKKDAISLWKLAEIHLGSGNLTLARGYFETLVVRHPESALAPFAQLRILDIQALRIMERGQYEELALLVPKLEGIKSSHRGELAALIALRTAYWSQEAVPTTPHYEVPPRVSSATYNMLALYYPLSESSRSAYLIGAIIISETSEISAKWSQNNAIFAENYFKRFSGSKTEKMISALKSKLYNKINSVIQTKIASGFLLEAINDFEALPSSMKSVRKNPQTAWALAEAYRKLDQPSKALVHYQEAASQLPEGSPDRFKGEFWVALLASYELKAKSKTATGAKNLEKLARDFDNNMNLTWNKMNEKNRDMITTAFKDQFEKAVVDGLQLKRPALIVLSQWSRRLNSKASTSLPSADELTAQEAQKAQDIPSASIFVLSDLAKVFGTMGMRKEKQEAILLMSKLKPSDFGDDQAAKDVWATQLIQLAEDYRKANQYLDAGRMFGIVGENGENFEKRAETLYKSGLLLFRAGRKAEAINSLQKAAEDGNNLFYANLAKERLNQIQ